MLCSDRLQNPQSARFLACSLSMRTEFIHAVLPWALLTYLMGKKEELTGFTYATGLITEHPAL